MMRRRWTHLLAAFSLGFAGLVAPPAFAAAAPIRLVVPPDIGELDGTRKVGDVVSFRIVNKDLYVSTALPPTSGTKRLNVDGMAGATRVSVTVRSRPDMPAVGLYFRLTNVDADADGPAASAIGRPSVQTTVYTRPGCVEISRVVSMPTSTASVTLTQRSAAFGAFAPSVDDDRVTLRVRRIESTTNEVREDVQLSAASMIDLMRHAPRQTAEHLGPIFRQFGQESLLAADLQLAWQVLADVLPTGGPETTVAVRDLVAALDDDDFRRRDGAYAGLQKLGGPAALVLMLPGGVGPQKLTAEQRSKVAAFLADYRPLTAEEALDRRHDPDFLVTCVAYSTEPAVRKAAAEALGAADPLGKAAAVAALDDAGARARAANRLRQDLFKAASTAETSARELSE